MAISTTIEQSKHLLVKLGLDPKTADMCWVKDYTGQWVLITDTQINVRSRLEGMYEYSGFQWQEHIALVPAWSLSALLEVMPIELEVGLFKTPISGEYFFSWWTDDHHMGDDYKEPIDAAYEMVHWLLENGYIKTKEK